MQLPLAYFFSFVFMGRGKNRQITSPALGGVESSVKLPLTKNSLVRMVPSSQIIQECFWNLINIITTRYNSQQLECYTIVNSIDAQPMHSLNCQHSASHWKLKIHCTIKLARAFYGVRIRAGTSKGSENKLIYFTGFFIKTMWDRSLTQSYFL